MSNSTLQVLRDLHNAAQALRMTAPVDDDFPAMMHNFDAEVKAAGEYLESRDNTGEVELLPVDGPSELQVYRWFQESTINHHIEEDGSHISKRAMFVAKKAWGAAVESLSAPMPPSAEQHTHWCNKCGYKGFFIVHDNCPYSALRDPQIFIHGYSKEKSIEKAVKGLIDGRKMGDSAVLSEHVFIVDHCGTTFGIYPKDQTTIVGTQAKRELLPKGTRLYLHPPTKPQRITEQDVREIIAAYQQFHPADYIAEFLGDWIASSNSNFNTLLAKINEHREPDYNNDELAADAIEKMAKVFLEKWHNHDGKYQWMIKYANDIRSAIAQCEGKGGV